MTNLEQNLRPLVTIAIPVFNGERYLEATLSSALAQSYDRLEIIVVDDGSTDGSCDIASSFKDSRIRLLRARKNEGIESAWNRCLDAATGHYMTLLPQDDLLLPSAVEERLALLLAEPEAALVFNARKIIDEKGGIITTRGAPFFEGAVDARRLMGSCVLSGMNHIGDPAAVMFSVPVARRLASGFSGRWPWVIDLEFWTRLMRLGQVYYLPRTLSAFRVNQGALSVQLRLHQAEQFQAFSRYACALYSLPKWFLPIGSVAAVISQHLRNLLYIYRWRGLPRN